MIMACDNCKYLFEASEKTTQCPDCGKFKVRQATQEEQKEYMMRKDSPKDDWE